MIAHTPGPWHIEPVWYPERAHPHVYAGTKQIAKPCNSADVPAPESDANAYLIAAAPDLLAICEAIYAWCGTDDGAAALPFEPPWAAQLREVIIKARGEQ
jgi:hypothetical protein